MSLLNKTSSAEHPSREAVLDHANEAKEHTGLHHTAMLGAQKAQNRLKKNESEGPAIFSK